MALESVLIFANFPGPPYKKIAFSSIHQQFASMGLSKYMVYRIWARLIKLNEIPIHAYYCDPVMSLRFYDFETCLINFTITLFCGLNSTLIWKCWQKWLIFSGLEWNYSGKTQRQTQCIFNVKKVTCDLIAFSIEMFYLLFRSN